ncbi:MAG: hypothetical protein AB3N33_09465 [Puniceicoccaceae bacterium]
MFLFPFLLQADTTELYWLKNASMEAAFSVGKGIRLEILRLPGGDNVLRESKDSSRGLKTWIMTPTEDIRLRDSLSEVPAQAMKISENEYRFIAEAANPLGLELEWLVRLDSDNPSLEILHRINNKGEMRPFLSIWSLIALGPGSLIQVPFSRSLNLSKNHPNDLAVFPYTDLSDGRISTSRDGLSLSIREGLESGSVKLGIVQQDGRLLVECHGLDLESIVPFDPMAEYPEGGSNITLYASPANRPDTMGEAEHVGPLRVLNLGESIEMVQTLRLSLKE